MARIKLETTQNVLLEFDLAGTGDRIVSGLLDWLFIGAYIFVCYLVFIAMLEIPSHLSGTGELIFFIVLGIPIAFYHPLFEIFLNGQSPGKKIMKIKVIKLDGSQPGLGDYILRWLFRTIDYMPFFFLTAIITISVSKKEQRIGDIVAGTTVVKLKKRATLEDTILKVVEHNYKPVFSDVLRFSDKDINTIKEALALYKKNNNPKHIDILAKKIRQLLATENNTMSSARLLDTIIKDYNFYTHDH
ncbi:MAG TPA: RDD family protein [Cytophagaceae bacterium]|nr:RDD family protein [Cytophagaceae bacterium]